MGASANHPENSQNTILASVVAEGLAGVSDLYWIFVAGIEPPAPLLLPAAVGVQVMFAIVEAAQLYRRPAQSRRVRWEATHYSGRASSAPSAHWRACS